MVKETSPLMKSFLLSFAGKQEVKKRHWMSEFNRDYLETTQFLSVILFHLFESPKATFLSISFTEGDTSGNKKNCKGM